jgi:DNA-directed RNA polymerase III subunit RPC1
MMLASFERTADHLFDAALHGQHDPVSGVSECIIMGQPIPMGTGKFSVLQDQSEGLPQPRPPLCFDHLPFLAEPKRK